ncbi:putative Ig domain-containing protein [Spirosoma lituiforme]
MFDLEAFIRQLLPINRRTDLNVGFVKLLFAPMASLLLAIETSRRQMVLLSKATGQVLLLEELLNQAAFSSSVGNIYILDGNYVTVDFQVVVPTGLAPSLISQLKGIVDAYKQAGKRYAIVEDATYVVDSNNNPFAWEAGYPYLNDIQIVFALKQTGQYRTVLKKDGVVTFDQPVNYTAGYPVSLEAQGTGSIFTLEVMSLTASLTRIATGAISQLTYQRSGQSLNVLAWINAGDVEVRLIGRNNTAYTDSFSDAIVWGSEMAGVSYNRMRSYTNVPSGEYTILARVKGQTATTALDINLTVPNQPPVVVNPMPNQSGKVGQYFTYSIPSNVFTDPDGFIAGFATTGLPPGISYNAGGPISGTPTTAGTYTVRVTAADDKGAAISDEFDLTIVPADSTSVDNNTPPPVVNPGATMIVPMNRGIMNLVAEHNGSKWRVRDTANYGIPQGKAGYFFINGNPYLTALPTTYDYFPGDEITVWYTVATSPDVSASQWDTKAHAKVVFGQI